MPSSLQESPILIIDFQSMQRKNLSLPRCIFMLSILIPVFNQNASSLVTTLHEQCADLITLKKESTVTSNYAITDFDFEIIVIDDASYDVQCKTSNRTLTSLKNVKYVELDKNIGRAAIRNVLAQMAKYENLLFLDGDSGISSTDFIKNYALWVSKNEVINGGRIYQDIASIKDDHQLHYRYGTKFESLRAYQRRKEPYLNFHSNNFLIKKDLFNRIKFDETINAYGYEDILFGLKLKESKVEILHIDNPVVHLGLETNDIFLEKTRLSLLNLYQLYKAGKIDSTRLINFGEKCKSWSKMIIGLESIIGPLIESNLRSKRANVYLFQFWKICRWLEFNC